MKSLGGTPSGIAEYVAYHRIPQVQRTRATQSESAPRKAGYRAAGGMKSRLVGSPRGVTGVIRWVKRDLLLRLGIRLRGSSI